MDKGDKFTQSYTVSPALYEGFIGLFEDKNPLHVSDAYASSKGFREKVMHGNILGGFLSHFVGERLPTENVIIQTQKISFLKPIYMNDVLQLNAEVADIFDSVKTVEISFKFQNQSGVRIAKGMIQVGLI